MFTAQFENPTNLKWIGAPLPEVRNRVGEEGSGYTLTADKRVPVFFESNPQEIIPELCREERNRKWKSS
jgi:hypothetical protein